MSRKNMMMLATVAAAFGVWADTETVGDYTWTYQINGDTADITGVSPSTGAVTIPATLGGKPVTSIGSGAFYDCSGLTSVTIPDSVTSIESSAFSGCSGLTRVAIGNGLTYVGYGAFGNCTAIRDAELPGWQCDIPMENVERLVISQGTANIADYAFRECGNLKSVTVPNSVTNIGEYGFYNCCSLDSVTIPGSVENIGLGAFSHCSNLKGVTISPGVRSVGEQAFSECRVLESVAIPDSVTNIAGSAFSNCIGLKSVSIPGSMTNVNSSVFYGCSGVTNLTASFVPVGMSASQLQTVVIPDDTVCIKDWAFSDCSGLTGVTIPDGVTSIGSGAFQRCSGLKSVAIPDSVTSIGAYAFYGCSSLESATIPNSVTDIDFTAFLDGGSLANVAIPQCVCSGNETVMSLFGTNITNVVVSAGVTSIGRSTFYDCSNLRSVTIPGSVASIANYAFEDCAALRSVFFEGNAPNTVGSSLFSYYTKDFCRAYVHKGTTGWGVAIPGTWNGINISYIEDGFVEPVDPPLATYKVAYEPGAYGSGQSQSATKTYGKPLVLAGALFTRSGYTQTGWSVSPNGYWLNYALGAEYTANALITLYPYWTVDGGGEIMSETVNGLTWNFVVSDGEATIFGGRYQEWDDEEEDYTWEYIVAIPSDTSGTVTVPSSLGGYPVTAIGNGAFTECERITSVIIPSGVVSIGEDAFSDCTALVSVSIPEGLATIGNDAFDGCGRLSMVTLPSTLATIGSRAFDGCSSLYSMDIPGKVTTIGYHAFARCTGLRTVTVSELLRSQITSNGVFYKCSPAISYNDAGMVTVTFDANGGIGGGSGKQGYGSAIVVPTVTRTGYTFTGWQPLPLETVSSNDVTYTAQWMANSYSVKFNANGAEGTMSDQPMTYDVPAGLSALGFSKDDSYFRGWAKSAEGTVAYTDCAIVTNLTPVADGVVTLYAVWQRKSASALACEDMFAGTGTVLMNDDGSSVVTLTNDVGGTVEFPDNAGGITINLNGHNIFGDGGALGESALPGGPAIRIVSGDGDGETTRLVIVDTSEGEKGQIAGGGESGGIEMDEDAAPRVRFVVEDGIGVFNGDGTEQPWWELCPVEATLVAGECFKATLAELGYDVPTDGVTPYSVRALGLPAGLKLVGSKAVTKKVGKKTVVVTPANVEWWIEGVPTVAMDFFTNPPYLAITVDGTTTTEPLPIEVLAQEVKDLGELALGQTVNEQYYLPRVASGWTVSGLPTGLKYTAKLLTASNKVGKKTVVTTNALPYSVYGKTTKAGLFTITAKRKAGEYYETMKYRVLVRPNAVDSTVFGDELADITTMAYEKVDWDLTGDGGALGDRALPVVPSVVKVAGLPGGVAFAAKDTYAYANPKKKTGKYLKQKGQTIVGTPTKPGTYVVTFTKNVTTGTGKNKKTVAKTAQILWTVVENDAGLELAFNNAGGVIESGSVGLKYGDLMAFAVTSNATVTASGLPAGIKLAKLDAGDGGALGESALPGFAKYGFTGFTVKAGTYLVTVKATLNGKTVTQRVALKVDVLPAWAKGTFNGVVSRTGGSPVQGGDANAQAARSTSGLATVTVSAAGKISGKFQENGTNWTFSAACYTDGRARSPSGPQSQSNGSQNAVEAGTRDACPYQEFICSNVVAKYAYKVKSGKKTVTKYLTRTFHLSVAPVPIDPDVANVPDSSIRGVLKLTEQRLAEDGSPYQDEGVADIEAWQNLWARSDYKALGKSLFSTKSGKKTLAYKVFAVDICGDGDGQTVLVPKGGDETGLSLFAALSLKVTAAGAVTATLTYDTGKTAVDKKTKKRVKVYWKPACATVVVPTTPADAEVFEGDVNLYFAPSAANGFPGWSGEVQLVDGSW